MKDKICIVAGSAAKIGRCFALARGKTARLRSSKLVMIRMILQAKQLGLMVK